MTGDLSDVRQSQLSAAAAILGRRARRDEPIGPRTTYRVGGKAALFIEIDDHADLVLVARAVGETEIPVVIVGRGSNLLVADAGFAGLAISLGASFASIELDDAGGVTAGAAVALPVLARKTANAGVGGFEWMVGVPGSVGGAVAMNAGGHGAETADNLVVATVFDLTRAAEQRLSRNDLRLAYRSSALTSTDLVVSARFAGIAGADRLASLRAIDEIVSWRREHQPGGRNCGSVFTNPLGDTAGRLIELAGLRGHRVGSAKVSEKHANFIQADADGSADDVHRLIEEVQGLVAVRTGVQLRTELRFAGFER